MVSTSLFSAEFRFSRLGHRRWNSGVLGLWSPTIEPLKGASLKFKRDHPVEKPMERGQYPFRQCEQCTNVNSRTRCRLVAVGKIMAPGVGAPETSDPAATRGELHGRSPRDNSPIKPQFLLRSVAPKFATRKLQQTIRRRATRSALPFA